MRSIRRFFPVAGSMAAFLALAGCGPKADPVRDFDSMQIGLPNGRTILAEVMRTEEDTLRGMMFRDSLPEGHGMLFIYGKQGKYSSWMYEVRIPLDIVWIAQDRRVVEVVPDAQPCKSLKKGRDCPHLGGHQPAQFVLELPAGDAAKNGIWVGSVMSF
jgi:uncharacterized protein